MTLPMLRGGGESLQQWFPSAHCVSTKFSQGSEVVPTCSQSLCPFHELPTAARRDLLLWALPAAPCPLRWRMTKAEGPTGIIQVVLRTLCFKQYGASWCAHKVNGLKFVVARQTEVETFLMKLHTVIWKGAQEKRKQFACLSSTLLWEVWS